MVVERLKLHHLVAKGYYDTSACTALAFAPFENRLMTMWPAKPSRKGKVPHLQRLQLAALEMVVDACRRHCSPAAAAVRQRRSAAESKTRYRGDE